MKLSKCLFLAFAGLGLFACSNEEVNEGALPYTGEATVNVKLNLPELLLNKSRSGEGMVAENGAVSSTSEATTPLVVNSIRIVLNAANGVQQEEQIDLATLDDHQIANVQFEGVRSPESVQVFINENEGENIKDLLSIDRINAAKLAAPLYGEAIASDTDIADGNGFSWNESVKTYTAVVTPAPRYARLELSEISHDVNHKGTTGCMFEEATFKGVFLQNVLTSENGEEYASASEWADLATDKYSAPTWSLAANADNNFLKSGNVWPEGENMCYAYSIFEGTPSVVFALENAKVKSNYIFPGWTNGSMMYAKVNSFKLKTQMGGSEETRDKYGIAEDGITIEKFKAGNIYKISDIQIPDEAWGPTPEGNSDVTVVAVVNILPWNILYGTVDWN